MVAVSGKKDVLLGEVLIVNNLFVVNYFDVHLDKFYNH